MTLRRFTKTNSDVLDYAFNFAPTSAWLATSEQISSVTITHVPSGGLAITSITNTGSSILLFVASGKEDQTFTVECAIVTNQGRQTVRSFEIEIVGKR